MFSVSPDTGRLSILSGSPIGGFLTPVLHRVGTIGQVSLRCKLCGKYDFRFGGRSHHGAADDCLDLALWYGGKTLQSCRGPEGQSPVLRQ